MRVIKYCFKLFVKSFQYSFLLLLIQFAFVLFFNSSGTYALLNSELIVIGVIFVYHYFEKKTVVDKYHLQWAYLFLYSAFALITYAAQELIQNGNVESFFFVYTMQFVLCVASNWQFDKQEKIIRNEERRELIKSIEAIGT